MKQRLKNKNSQQINYIFLQKAIYILPYNSPPSIAIMVSILVNRHSNMFFYIWWGYSNQLIAHRKKVLIHYNIKTSVMASKINGGSIVCSIVCSRVHQRKHQNSASLALVRAIHRWLVNSPHKGPATRKMFPFDDVTMMYWRITDIIYAPMPLVCAIRHCQWQKRGDKIKLWLQFKIR